MIGNIILGLHSLSALFFLPIMLLPFSARRWKSNSEERLLSSVKRWTIFLRLLHIFLVLSFFTGLWMMHKFESSWFWVVIVLYAVMGALLGIVAKNVRNLIVHRLNNKFSMRNETLVKIIRLSSALSITLVIVFVVMIVRW